MPRTTHSSFAARTIGALLALQIFSIPADSESLAYNCEILSAYDLSGSGTLKPSGFSSYFVGSKFAISRVDGHIVGSVLPTILAKTTTVLSKGDERNSFRAAAVFENESAGRSVQLIDVQEWVSGSTKPFVASSMAGAGIITGICE